MEGDRNRMIVKARREKLIRAAGVIKSETVNYRRQCQPYFSVLFTRFITLRSSLTFKVI